MSAQKGSTALSHYVSATKYVMEQRELSDSYFTLLLERFTPLRFYLACRVCNKLLRDPMTPDHTACQHTVCSECVGGKMKLKPSCGWCQGYENFKLNSPLAGLLIAYSTLCQYVLSSAHHRDQLQFLLDANGNRPDVVDCAKKLEDILVEGSQFSDPEGSATSVEQSPSAATFVSTITTEPTDEKPPIKLTIRNVAGHNKVATAPIPKRKKSCSSADEAVMPGEQPRPVTQTSGDSSRRHQRKSSSLSNTNEHPPRRSFDTSRKKSRNMDKRGCGCGNATTVPGKLTCYGQRCACYSSHNPCIDCRCKGCRNPNKYVKIEKASDDTDNDEINVE